MLSLVIGPIMTSTVPPGPGRQRRATGCVADGARSPGDGDRSFTGISG
jgi:hypothetical protein